MQQTYYVRIGLFGHVGRFVCAEPVVHNRGRRVICRTRRGLEIGEVLSQGEELVSEPDGHLLRAVTVEDDLLIARLNKNRDAAYEKCVQLLQEKQLDTVLMDVEQLFDGQSLYFYFLGDVTSKIESITQELADAYETKVQFREFADAVERGCGPDCGTESAEGCGTGCSSCSVAAACKK